MPVAISSSGGIGCRYGRCAGGVGRGRIVGGRLGGLALLLFRFLLLLLLEFSLAFSERVVGFGHEHFSVGKEVMMRAGRWRMKRCLNSIARRGRARSGNGGGRDEQ